MSDAPGRVWVEEPDIFDGCGFWHESGEGFRPGTAHPYVRADLFDALKAENEWLRDALRPFAKEADAWLTYHDNEPLVEGFRDYYGEITVGDLRRAATALTASDATTKTDGNDAPP